MSDQFDQCDERSVTFARCHHEAGHSGPHTWDEIMGMGDPENGPLGQDHEMSIREVAPVTPDRGGVSEQIPEAADMGSLDGCPPREMPPGRYTAVIVGTEVDDNDVHVTIRVDGRRLSESDADQLSGAADRLDGRHGACDPLTPAERKEQGIVSEYLRKLAKEARDGAMR